MNNVLNKNESVIKKRRIRIPLAVKIILIALTVVVLVFGIIMGNQLYEMSKMSSIQTGEVIPGIYAVNNQMVNIYFIKGNDGYIMIDGGTDKNMTVNALEQIGISVGEITSILLTHTDTDHTSSLALFPNAQIYLSDKEVQMIDGTTPRSPLGGNSLSVDYKTLSDDDIVILSGLSVRCILTPGHTPGSMCYLINDKYLFTGDTLSLKDGKADLFNSFFNMDDEIQRSTLYMLAEKIDETGTSYIFSAHYGYSDDPLKAFENWKK